MSPAPQGRYDDRFALDNLPHLASVSHTLQPWALACARATFLVLFVGLLASTVWALRLIGGA